jgi:hypothetical protein
MIFKTNSTNKPVPLTDTERVLNIQKQLTFISAFRLRSGRRPVTATARVLALTNPKKICGGKRGTGTSYSWQ